VHRAAVESLLLLLNAIIKYPDKVSAKLNPPSLFKHEFSIPDILYSVPALFKAMHLLQVSDTIHHDLKSENVLVKSGNTNGNHYPEILVIDFGGLVHKTVDANTMRDSATTPCYAPPEFRNEKLNVDGRVDLEARMAFDL
jgi:serine/threonine protein kinase